MQLSKRFTLESLSKTSTGVTNTPNQAVIVELTKLAYILDEIYDTIGPFTITSAYRSQETQEALKSSGNVQAISKSYHTTGQAADITPTKEGVGSFFFKLVADKNLSSKLGGFAIKNNTIHLDTDTTKRVAIPMKVMSDGSYVRLRLDEIQAGLDKYGLTVVQAAGLSMGLVALLGALGFLVYKIYYAKRS